MADEKIDGRDVAGWKAQWDAMKAENDVLNPKLDAAEAKLRERGLLIAELQRQIGEVKAAAEAAAQQHAGALARADEALVAESNRSASLKAELEESETFRGERDEEIAGLKVAIAESKQETTAAKQLAEKRRAVLAEVMRLVAAVHESISPLIAE